MPTEKKHSIVVKLTRRVLIAVLLVCLLATVLWFGYIYGGEALCQVAINQMAEMTSTQIYRDSVEFNPDGSVIITGLTISGMEDEDSGASIFAARDVYVQFSLKSILKAKPRLKQILIDNFVVDAQYDVDRDLWNLSSLKLNIPEGGAGELPVIKLTGGRLRYSKASGGDVKTSATLPLAAVALRPNLLTGDGYEFTLATGTLSSGFGKSRLLGTWKPGILTLAGGIASEDVPELAMAWTIERMAAEFKYGEDRGYELKLRVTGLESRQSPEIGRFAAVGPNFVGNSACYTVLKNFFDKYQARGLIDLSVDASGNLNELSKSKLSGKVTCRDVAMRYHKFDYPVDSLTGTVSFTQKSVTLEDLRGKHMEVELAFAGWTRDFGPNWTYDIHVTSDDMVLDEDMYKALSESRRKMWDMLTPCGLTAVDYHMTRSSPTDKARTLTLELDRVQAKYLGFPYPLDELDGKVVISGASTEFVDVVSEVDSRRIVINGSVETASNSSREYEIRIDVNNLPLDSTLEASLPERHKGLYEQFNASGFADGTIHVSGSSQKSQCYMADLHLKDTSLDCNDLPLSLTDVTAHVILQPGQVDVEALTGRHGETSMVLDGVVRPSDASGRKEYDVKFTLSNAEINDDLLDLLPANARKSVKEMNPRGRVNLEIELDSTNGAGPTDYRIGIECLGNSATLPQFPYPLAEAKGKLVVYPGRIEIEEISAVPGEEVGIVSLDSAIRLKGEVTLSEGAFESAVLSVVGENIFFDKCLAEALPKGTRPFYDRLLPVGLFDVDLYPVEIRRVGSDGSDIDFGGTVNLKKCRFRISGAETEVDNVRLLVTNGKYEGGEGFRDCDIEVAAKNVRIQGKSMTDLTAHLGYDRESAMWSMGDIVADCYGGKLLGTLDINQPQDGPMDYVLKVAFADLELRDFMADTRRGSGSSGEHSSGTMDGSLCVSAVAGDSSSRIGTCRIMIEKMKVGRLSPLVNVFQVLKLSLPTEFAFDEMYVDSYIKGNGLIVKKLDLAGESLAFYGSGMMDLESRDVDLKLTGRGKRLATADPSLFASLSEEIGKAMVRIYVTGSFYDPVIETKTLPILTGPLDIFGRAVTSSSQYKP